MNIEKLKLYHYPSTRSARVKWALHEAVGDNFEVEVVPLYEGVQYTPEYMEKNLNHNVPTLEITTTSGESINMIESGAMVALLADAFPDKNLAPPPDKLSIERADYLQMLHFGAATVDMILWQIRVHEHLLPKAQRDARTLERYRSKFGTEVEPQLVSRLEKSPFICGDVFTAADCIIGHDVLWGRMYQLCDDEIFSQYLSRLSTRPAYIKAFSDASEFTPELPEGMAELGIFTG